MPSSEELTDKHLAALLAKDAENARLGISRSNKKPSDAPKPNIRFLRNIIRDTDSHNAALLARDKRSGSEANAGIKRKLDNDDDIVRGADEHKAKRRSRDRPDRWSLALGRSTRPRSKEPERRQDGHRDESRRKLRAERKTQGRSEKDVDVDRANHRKHRPRPGSRSGRLSPHREDPGDRTGHRRSSRPISRSRSPKPHDRRATRKSRHEEEARKFGSQYKSTDSDSDPLDTIIGPRPPPSVRPRGRGVTSESSGIDARFTDPSYDPRNDLQPAPDLGEDEDWEMALSALRDRARWRTAGAERLRDAGFSEDEIQKWEKKSSPAAGMDSRERDVEDVVWKKHGESRDWDRGKVLREDGGVETKVAWAQKSGT